MGHLLSSINPESAAEIRGIPADPRRPGVGEVVIYHMRTGHGRQGRTRFPAIVQESRQGERGLALTVIMEAGELKNETLVEEIGPGKDGGHCWERPDVTFVAEAFRNTVTALTTRVGDLETQVAFVAEAFRNTVTALTTRVGDLETQVADLRKVVLGDFDPPRISIIDIMQDFENRLRDIANQAGAEVAKGRGKRK